MKEKFLIPKVDAYQTRRNFTAAAEKWNLQFYDEDGKFIRKGSRIISTQQKEIFMALIAVMNARLKQYNNTYGKKYNEYRNMVKDPFTIKVSTADIQNMLMQGAEYKTEKGKRAIKYALERFADPELNIIIHKKFRREYHKYDIKINPEITHFIELAPESLNYCKLELSKTKKTKCTYYTMYNLTNINNNKSNHKDFISGKNPQANFQPLNYKNKNIKEQGKSIPDNRTIREKQQEYEQLTKEITEKIKLSGGKKSPEKIEDELKKTIPQPKKTKAFSKGLKKINDDFSYFKNKVIRDFYVTMIYMLFSFEKAESYSPYNLKSPFYAYIVQSLNELETNPLYFGKCLTIEDFTRQKIFLTDALVRMKKYWINTRIDFNLDYVAPNRFLNGSYDRFKFENAVHYHRMKLKQKRFKKSVKAKKRVSKNQYEALLNRLFSHAEKNAYVQTDVIIQKYFRIGADMRTGNLKYIKPREEYDKEKIYGVLQSYFNN